MLEALLEGRGTSDLSAEEEEKLVALRELATEPQHTILIDSVIAHARSRTEAMLLSSIFETPPCPRSSRVEPPPGPSATSG